MKKPNFNPLFYSFMIYGFSTGGSAPSRARVATTSTVNEGKDSSTKAPDTINRAELQTAQQGVDAQRLRMLQRLENELKGDKGKATRKGLRRQIRSYYLKAKSGLRAGFTHAQLSAGQSRIEKKTREFDTQIDNAKDLIKNKEQSKERMKQLSQKTIVKFLKERNRNKDWKKNIETQHLVYTASSYLLRWERVNAIAIDSNANLAVAKEVYNNLKTADENSQIIKDLRGIEGDINEVCTRWAEGKNSVRDVYSNKDWDEKYEKEVSKKTPFNRKGHMIMQFRGIREYSYRKRGGWVQDSYRDLNDDKWYRADTGSRSENKVKPGDVEDYLEFAREQAKKGIYPPLPDMFRGNGRAVARITAAINPEQMRLSLKLHANSTEYQRKLNVAGKKNKIKFATPLLNKEQTEAFIDVNHNGKKLGSVKMTPDGKRFLTLGKRKPIDISAMNEAAVIKQIEDLELKPIVNDIMVEKVGGKTSVKVRGVNMPTGKPKNVDLGKSPIKLASFLSGKVDVSLAPNLSNIDTTIKTQVKASLLAGVEQYPKLKAQITSKVTDAVIGKLKENLYAKSKRPQLIIIGKASLEGSLKENRRLANTRADKALIALQKKSPGVKLEKIYDVKKVAIVAGHDGKNVTNEGQAWEKMMKKWNKDKSIKQKVKTVDELKAKIRKPRVGPQSTFAKKNFDDQRGAFMQVLPAKSEPSGFNMSLENAAPQPPAPAVS